MYTKKRASVRRGEGSGGRASGPRDMGAKARSVHWGGLSPPGETTPGVEMTPPPRGGTETQAHHLPGTEFLDTVGELALVAVGARAGTRKCSA
jgi:hypothetical protein